MRALQALLLVVAASLLSGCGYNTIQVQDEATKSAWSEVVNQYQRRADLIPNLVNTVRVSPRRSRPCCLASPRRVPGRRRCR